MTKLFVRRVGNALQPDGADCAAVFSKLPFGRAIQVDIKQPRNVRFHRLYWALVNRIADAIGSEPETVSDLLKIETGHCTLVRSKKYGDLRLPQSISFAKMDEMAFRKFFDACVLVIHENWGIAVPDILSAVEDLLHPEAA
jgi:hypothetical protein